MAYVELTTLEIYNKCNILENSSCEISIGDTIRVGCWVYWNDGNPDNGYAPIKLLFKDASALHTNEITFTGRPSNGWFAENHVVTASDIEGLGTLGYLCVTPYTAETDAADCRQVEYTAYDPCSLSLDKTSYNVGETIYFTFYNAPPDGTLEIVNSKNLVEKLWYVNGDGTRAYTIPSGSLGGTWKANLCGTGCDLTETFTIIAPLPCSQLFNVYEEGTTNGIPSASVVIKSGTTIVDSCSTNQYGNCSCSDLIYNQTYTFTVSKTGYYSSPATTFTCGDLTYITVYLEKLPTPDCEYTGYSCDGMVDSTDLPENAKYGDTITSIFKIDNIYPLAGRYTNYRVKFELNNGDPTYSESFLLISQSYNPFIIDLHDVQYSFSMPNQDSTLKVTVERCTSSGTWEQAGADSDAIRNYTITLAKSDEALGEFVEGSYPKTIPAANYDLGWDYHFKSKVKNVGAEDGKFEIQLFLDDNPLYWFSKLNPFSSEPPLLWNTIKSGDIEDYDNDISFNLKEGSTLTLKLWEKTKYDASGEPDQIVEIPIGAAEPCPSWANRLAEAADISCTAAKLVIIAFVAILALSMIGSMFRR